MAKDKFYIATSIPYANGKPHMGHPLDALYGDVLKRHYKKQGKEVLLQVGLDENGQTVYQKAEAAGVSIEKWLEDIRPAFLELEKKLNIDYDVYTRTSDEVHHLVAQELWKRADANGDIYKKKYKGLYCVGCEAFVMEDDLVDGKCPDHGKAPELLEEENYFFALSKYRIFLKELFEKNKDFAQPRNYYNEAYNMIDSLEDVSISRPKERLPWGVPVPGDADHVMYVWFDALTNYLTAVNFLDEQSEEFKFWPPDVEIIGKDNNRWHTLLWPAMLASGGIEVPKVILIHGHITAKGGIKMSKTLGNTVDPIGMIDKYGTDALRYYLLSRIPLDSDGAFDEELFREVYAADLSNGIGNLFQRTLSMINKYEVKVDPYASTIKEESSRLPKGTVGKFTESFKFNEALDRIWSVVAFCNKAIEEQKPWELSKSNPADLKDLLQMLFEYLNRISEEISPFMPETSEKMKKQLASLKPEPLFPRLED